MKKARKASGNRAKLTGNLERLPSVRERMRKLEQGVAIEREKHLDHVGNLKRLLASGRKLCNHLRHHNIKLTESLEAIRELCYNAGLCLAKHCGKTPVVLACLKIARCPGIRPCAISTDRRVFFFLESEFRMPGSALITSDTTIFARL